MQMDKKRLESLFLKVQKPARYTGGELNSVVKNAADMAVRIAFCFPDLYEVGMSHLGMKILYGLYNAQEDTWCERVFAPDTDMEDLMRQNDIPLFALESRDAVADFDFVAFTLQYEMSYTGVLNMLDLAGIPLRAADRNETHPLVIGGGPCACNPEPMADFFDLFILGEGEEVNLELNDLYKEHKRNGYRKDVFLRAAAQIEGVYVPSLYAVSYNEDGTIASVTPKDNAPATVRKRIVRDLNSMYYPEYFVVPFTNIVHDRAMSEIFRGCIRGCRFCQAGFIYRPVREKSIDTIDRQSRALCDSTGYEEFSLSSLSTSDYTKLPELLETLLDWAEPQHTNMSLPSLRVDGFSEELANKLNVLRRSGLTFAPEAGTQRLRDAINKNLSEAEILDTVGKAFRGGWSAVKLYFMMGLPTETAEDIVGIAQLAQKVTWVYHNTPDKPKGKGVTVSVSCSCFVPKPFTPFQWEPQDTMEQLMEKQKLLSSSVTTRKISLSWHDAQTSFLEAVLARGDRRLGAVIEDAYRQGCKLDSWSEHFRFDTWLETIKAHGLDPAFYANRRRDKDEIFPWDHLDYGVSKAFLWRENEKAHAAKTTPNCREQCSGCGATCFKGGVCYEHR
ncbi:MAG: TIGR03960 family B12-binding radical SAM protein [Ruminococcaceae bacterium]|nr:TIGR03960 family B12-binding radical SAM protein [Oscillospiraceae bacterium]